MDGPAPVAVGIDGSKSALRAALWATDEATSRDTALRLIHVIDTDRDDDSDDALVAGQHALHAAWEAVAATGKPVKLESEILYGSPGETLVHYSSRCALICLGHKGMHDSSPGDRGATVNAVVHAARSSVAIVRRNANHSDPSYRRWILVVLDDSAEAHEVFQAAFDEAILRQAPLLALTAWSDEGVSSLDGFLEQRSEDRADVQLCSLPMPHHFLNLLRQSAGIDQLLVVGQGRRDLIEELTAPATRKVLRKSWCSVLVVRDPTWSAHYQD